MSGWWKLFKLVCFLQMLATVYFALTAFISLFQSGDLYYLLETAAFGLMTALAILALHTIGNNYPDKPISGKHKAAFNWLFLMNFLLIAFLFGLFFAELNQLRELARLATKPILSFPASYWLAIIAITLLIIFQFIILFGLYQMRKIIYVNFFARKQFEFETEGRN